MTMLLSLACQEPEQAAPANVQGHAAALTASSDVVVGPELGYGSRDTFPVYWISYEPGAAVAADGSQFVVWTDGQRLWMKRVSPAGEPLDATTKLIFEPGPNESHYFERLGVFFDGEAFVVSGYDAQDFFWQRFDGQGNAIDKVRSVIHAQLDHQHFSFAQAASKKLGITLYWSASKGSIEMVRMGAHGLLKDVQPKVLFPQAQAMTFSPYIASVGDEFCVAYIEGDKTRVAWLDADGNLAGDPVDLPITEPIYLQGVRSNGEDCVVGSETQTYGQFILQHVNRKLEFATPHSIAITHDDPNWFRLLLEAKDGSLSFFDLTEQGSWPSDAQLAWIYNGSEGGVWLNEVQSPDTSTIYGPGAFVDNDVKVRIDLKNRKVVHGLTPLLRRGAEQVNPRLGNNGSAALLTWTEGSNRAPSADSYGSRGTALRITADGAALDQAPFLPFGTQSFWSRSAIASDGANFMVWAAQTGVPIHTDGSFTAPGEVPYGVAPYAAIRSGDHYVTLGNEPADDAKSGSVVLHFYDDLGNSLQSTTVGTFGGAFSDHDGALMQLGDGYRTLQIAWPNAFKVSTLDKAGALVGEATQWDAGLAGQWVNYPTLATGGGTTWLSWESSRFADGNYTPPEHFTVAIARLAPDATGLDAHALSLSDGRAPHLAADETGARVVWVEGTSDHPRVLTRRVTSPDVGPRGGFLVGEGDSPQLSYLGNGRYLVAYQRYVPELFAKRVFVRTLDNASATSGCAADCTGFCVDGVCCASECGQGDPNDCMACSVAAGGTQDGVCTPLSAQRAPTVLCRGAADVCNGSDVCSSQSTECPDTHVADGSACLANGIPTSCAAGVCTLPNCDDSDPCTVDTLTIHGTCAHAPYPSPECQHDAGTPDQDGGKATDDGGPGDASIDDASAGDASIDDAGHPHDAGVPDSGPQTDASPPNNEDAATPDDAGPPARHHHGGGCTVTPTGEQHWAVLLYTVGFAAVMRRRRRTRVTSV